MKVCRRCLIEKDNSEFSFSPTHRDRLRSHCISCCCKDKREWRIKNPDKCKKARIAWRLKNPEKERERKRRSWVKNKEKWNLRNRLIRSTIKGRLSRRMSAGLWRALRQKKDNRAWESIVGYIADELKKHIESRFQRGMSWSNMGKWHIDHIVPVSFFKYKTSEDQEFKYCWSLDNLQPLWEGDNCSKCKKTMKEFCDYKKYRKKLKREISIQG